MSATDLITAGENLYTAVAGGTISEKVAANITDAGSVISLMVSIASRNITSVDVDGIVAGATETLTGITAIVEAAKKKTSTSTPASTTTTAS